MLLATSLMSILWQGAFNVAPGGTGGGGAAAHGLHRAPPPPRLPASCPCCGAAAIATQPGPAHPKCREALPGAGRGLQNAWETCEAHLSLLTHETLPPHLGAGGTHIAVLRPALPSCTLVSSLQAPPRHDAVPLRPPNWAYHWGHRPPCRHRGAAPAPRPAAPAGPKGTMRVV